MNSQGSNWMPSMSMPPLGFGVIMPQPAGNAHRPVMKNSNGNSFPISDSSPKTWQYQQYLLTQQGLPMPTDSVTNVPVYPQQYFASTQQQQQWVLQQQRAAQGQRLLYEKYKKQQQFNEQKQRLQDFSSCKSKGTCSADIMIQNILSKDETTARPRNEKREPIFSCIEADDKNTNVNAAYVPTLNPSALGPSSFQKAQLIQPPLSGLPNSSQPYVQNTESCINGQGLSYVLSYYTDASPVAVNPVVSVNLAPGKKQNDNDTFSNSTSSSYSVPQKVPLQLPEWLKEFCNIPEVYKKACNLVESSDGWVDTSRAYMLLMRTNVPPHLLGVLWEMVNRNEPGRLQIAEFCGLLALVALIQNGKTFSDAEILKSTVSPVFPLIDHPTLLPLSQAELSKQQKRMESNSSVVIPQDVANAKPVAESFQDDDDEFDDFVSAVPPSQCVIEKVSVTPIIPASKLPAILSAIVIPAPIVHKSKACDQERSLNFPTLGNSPQNHNKCGENKESDEFSDFQSAFNSSEDIILSLKTTKDAKDKYDVFRELTKDGMDSDEKNNNGLSENDEEIDKSFGEFCSSAPPLMTEIPRLNCDVKYSNPGIKEDAFENLAHSKLVSQYNNEPLKNDCLELKIGSIISANNWAKDPFGEFEVSNNKVNSMATDFSSDSSQYVTANASTETSSEPDDDFGDFIGPSETTKEVIFNPGIYSANLPELQSETQSVASLELPGLEMTVNLSADAFKVEPPTRNDEQIDFESQFKSLSFDVPFAKCSEKECSQLPLPAVTPESIPIADKYSIIRDVQQMERSFEEPHIESWKKCLNGCDKLLLEGLTILESIQDKMLLTQVLETSQMQDYLLNLSNINEVQSRIQVASQNMTSTTEIQALLRKCQDSWKSISTIVGEKLFLKEVKSNQESKDTNDENICSLCLQSGGATLQHGGLSYHPPCANLWLNIVDVTLPSLIQTKGSFL